jgi:hypothetical protein
VCSCDSARCGDEVLYALLLSLGWRPRRRVETGMCTKHAGHCHGVRMARFAIVIVEEVGSMPSNAVQVVAGTEALVLLPAPPVATISMGLCYQIAGFGGLASVLNSGDMSLGFTRLSWKRVTTSSKHHTAEYRCKQSFTNE